MVPAGGIHDPLGTCSSFFSFLFAEKFSAKKLLVKIFNTGSLNENIVFLYKCQI